MVSESEHHYQPRVKIKLIIQPLATVSLYSPYTHTALNPTEFSKPFFPSSLELICLLVLLVIMNRQILI